MGRVFRHWRRLLLGVFLFGLGYVLHQRLPPLERWSVRLERDAAETIFSFSADGQFVFSHRLERKGSEVNWGWAYGPFRKRDGATGQLLAEVSTKWRIYQSHSVVHDLDADSPDILRSSFWAGLPKNEKGILELFELDSGKEQRLPIKSFSGEQGLILSPAEDMVAIFCYKDPEKKKLEVDVFLHALPGGEQLAVLSTTAEALFSPDGSYFIYPSTSPEGPCLRLWDTRKRLSGGVLPGAPEISEISPNGRFLLATPVKGHHGKTKLWDLSDRSKPRGVAVLSVGPLRLKFTPDSRTLVQLPTTKNRDVVFWESATGLEKGRTPIPFLEDAPHVIASDDRLLALREGGYAGNFPIAVIDLPSRKLLWHKQLGEPVCKQGSNLPAAITPGDVDTLFLSVFDDHLHQHPEFRSARTGELLASFSMPFRRLRSAHSGDGQLILIYGHSQSPRHQKQGWFWESLRKLFPSNPDNAFDLIRVIDVPTLREVFHLADSHVENAQLSPDGGTLLTIHPKDPAGPHLRCWDIPGRHPWLKIVGIPAAIGLFFLLWGKWRRARKARQARPKPAPAQPPSGVGSAGLR